MSRRGVRILWALIVGGVLVRTVVAFATVGIEYDIDNLRRTADRLLQPDPLSLYPDVNVDMLRWPYPSGYFPWLLIVDRAERWTGLEFHGLVQLLPIAADAGLAWVVQAYLGLRGASERTRLVAAGLVALGPSFALVSGYEGQLDAVALLPAAAGLLAWERLPVGHRALAAGLLIGVGASVKTVPIVVVLALLPWVSSRREGVVLLASTLAVPAIAVAPWFLAEPDATLDALRYTGLPGLGGLSLLAQPGLADNWLLTHGHELSGLTETLLDLRTAITVGFLAAVTVLLLRRRPDPAQGAVIVWLTVFTLGLNFGPRYLIWGLPFMLMAGYLRESAALQVLGFTTGVILLGRPYESEWVATLYFGLMMLLLACFTVWLVSIVLGERVRSRAA